MRATVDVTISCTIEDQFRLIELARQEVEAIKRETIGSCTIPSLQRRLCNSLFGLE